MLGKVCRTVAVVAALLTGLATPMGVRGEPATAGWQIVAPVRTPPILYRPAGMATDSRGHVYVADPAAQAVQVLNGDGTPVATWSGAGGLAFKAPQTVAVGPSGRVYVGDARTGVVFALNNSGGLLRSWHVEPAPSSPYGGAFSLFVDQAGHVWSFTTDLAAGMRVSEFSQVGHHLRGWTSRLHHTIDRSFDCVISPTPCQGDLTTVPLGIAVVGGSVVVSVEALTCGGGRDGSCRGYCFFQEYTNRGRFAGEWHAHADPVDSVLNPAGLIVTDHGTVIGGFGPDLRSFDPTRHTVRNVAWYPPPWTVAPTGVSTPPDITGLAREPDGRIDIALGLMRVVQQVSPKFRVIATWGGTVSDTFNRPHGIAVDALSRMYVADTNDRVVKQLAPGGETLATWGTEGFPVAIAAAPDGNVCVAGVASKGTTIQWFNQDGHALGSITLPPEGSASLAPNIVSLAVDGREDVYVVDDTTGTVEELTQAGTVLRTYPAPSDIPQGSSPHPEALALDTHGNLWVALGLPDQVVEYGPDAAVVRAWPLQSVTPGVVGIYVTGLAIAPSGNVWIAANEVQERNPSGAVVRAWTEEGSTPGAFMQPAGIAIDSGESVYVVDSWNDDVQKRSG